MGLQSAFAIKQNPSLKQFTLVMHHCGYLRLPRKEFWGEKVRLWGTSS
jgi:hypothetical protein